MNQQSNVDIQDLTSRPRTPSPPTPPTAVEFGKWIDLRDADGDVAAAARLTLETRLAAVHAYLSLAALKADESLEHVHQLRVSTRRVLAAIGVYEDVLPRKQARWFAKRMKRIRKTAGEARDLDVLLQRYRKRGARSTKRLLRRLKRLRERSQESILQLNEQFVESGLLQQRTLKLLLSISGDEQLSLGEFASAAVRKQADLFLHSGRRKPKRVDDLHQFRIQAKKLRYTIELLSDALPPELRTLVYPVVCKTQNILGELNDHSIAITQLKRLAKSERRRRAAKRFRKLARHEKRNIQRATLEFQSWWTPDFTRKLNSMLQNALADN